MPQTLKRIRGMDVELVASKLNAGATPLQNWTKFSADVQINEYDDSAATATFDQFSPGRRKATGSVEGFAGGQEHLAGSLPQPGDELLTLGVQTVTEGEDLLQDLGDETTYGKIIVTKTHYEQADAPGTWSFDWRSGGH